MPRKPKRKAETAAPESPPSPPPLGQRMRVEQAVLGPNPGLPPWTASGGSINPSPREIPSPSPPPPGSQTRDPQPERDDTAFARHQPLDVGGALGG